MEQKFTRLKLSLLVRVLAATLAALFLGSLVLHYLVDGLFQEPFARLFVWALQALFGQTRETALEWYRLYVQDLKHVYIGAAIVVIMLVAFWFAMGVFTRWLNRIRAAVHQVADETGEPVKLPRQLAPVQKDLTAVQTALREREQRARQEEQRKNDLLVFLAHDLKTPLTSVIGYLNLLQDDPALTTEQRAKYIGIALDKALRLEDLMLQFFEITRESLHGAPVPRDEVQLSFLLEQLTDEFLPLFPERGLTCRADISPCLTVRGDADKLARVFDNVLRNAVHYSCEGGLVEIEALRRDNTAVITIRNEGLTIPEQELARIFEKFYRLDSARSSRTGGAGLGLAIAKEIVEGHGGSIRAESNARKTAFIIEIPVL